MAKRCDAAAGTDDNSAAPQLVMALACLVQTNGGPTRLLSALLRGSNRGIDTRSRTAKALKSLLDSCQRLIVSRIFNGQYDAIGNEEYETERLRRLFTTFEYSAELNAELLQSTVYAVLVTRQTVRLQLKNGQIIGKDDLV